MTKRTRVRARRPRTIAREIRQAPIERKIPSRRYVYTPELLAYARHRFEHSDASLADIAVDLGVHKGTVGDLAKREGWVRYVPPPRDLAPSVRLLEAPRHSQVASNRRLHLGRRGMKSGATAPPLLTPACPRK